jgi:hypothetical protein
LETVISAQAAFNSGETVMSSIRAIGRAGLLAGASGLVWLGILASAQASHADTPLAPGDTAPATDTVAPTPGGSGPSYAPANPVDCTDPNNSINCQTPPIDSPLVSGTAAPGSPFRD